MEKKRQINWSRLILAVLIATFLFSFGMLFGYISRGIVENEVKALEENARNEILSVETLTLLEKDFSCNPNTIDIISEKLDSLGKLITNLEEQKGKNNQIVLNLKKLYTILEIRHILFIKERNNNCENNNSIILFFYSNEKECSGETDKTSFILSYIKRKYPTTMIYSFDINLKSDIIEFLKRQYSINGCTKVVLNNRLIGYPIENSTRLEEDLKNGL